MNENTKKILTSLWNVTQIILKTALAVALIFFSYEYLNTRLINEEVDHGDSFHSYPVNTLDVVTLGSSHAQYSFQPGFFYEDTGLYSYVMGSACQPLEASRLLLKEVYKTQTPKVVFLEVYTSLPLRSECEFEGCYVQAAYQMTGEERDSILGHLSEEKEEEYKNEFINNHNNWRTVEDYFIFLPNYESKDVVHYEDISTDFGYVFQYGLWGEYPGNWWWGVSHPDAGVTDLDEEDLNALNGIYEMCQEHGSTLILYKTPIDGMTVDDQQHLNAVWKWADEHSVSYVDFFEKQYDLNFYMWIHTDSYHSYITGASVITDYLVETMEGLGIEFDHVKDEQLDSMYAMNDEYYTFQYLFGEYDPTKLLQRFTHSNGYLAINYNAYNGYVPDYMIKFLEEAGVEEGSFVSGQPFYCLIRNNECKSFSHDRLEYKDENGTITMDEYGTYFNGVTIESSLTGFNVTYIGSNLYDNVNKNINTYTEWEDGMQSYYHYYR